MVHNLPGLAAAVLIAGFLALSGGGTANAMPQRLLIHGMHGMGGIPIRHHGGHGNHMWWRHHHHHDGGHFWGGPVWLGFGWSPFYDDDYYYGGWPPYTPPYSSLRAGSFHTRWCLERYRTYDPRSDTFIGGDGYRHLCRSPTRF